MSGTNIHYNWSANNGHAEITRIPGMQSLSTKILFELDMMN